MPASASTGRLPRVAYFPDTYHEVNGVARTARHLTDYALRKGLPFMCVRPGAGYKRWNQRSVEHIELQRGRLAVRVEKDLWQDPHILRYKRLLCSRFEEFRPNVVHVTSMGDFGLLGWRLAREFGLPIVASWHTNIHEYAAWRFCKAARFVPTRPRQLVSRGIEQIFLGFSLWFYRTGAAVMAPNPELVELLRQNTKKPAYLMERGVDSELFDCAKRGRNDGEVVFGYVGRLSTEKNLRVLKRLEDALGAARLGDYRFELVGHGSESEWLRSNLEKATLRGVLLGEPLAQAYADMDVLLFPSRTDTYGNVVWEAAASGVPAIVMGAGGPQYIVRDGLTGIVSRSDEEFVANAIRLYREAELRQQMGHAARKVALAQSWDAVFDRLYDEAYATAVA